MSQSSDARKQRLNDLKRAVEQYVGDEQKRIDNEVATLQKVLDGRTGGSGTSAISVKKVSAVALNDLQSFLQGA